MGTPSHLSRSLYAVDAKGQIALKDENDDQARAELLAAARELVSTLESPVERLSRMVYLEVRIIWGFTCLYLLTAAVAYPVGISAECN